jgi:hypothetical protein
VHYTWRKRNLPSCNAVPKLGSENRGRPSKSSSPSCATTLSDGPECLLCSIAYSCHTIFVLVGTTFHLRKCCWWQTGVFDEGEGDWERRFKDSDEYLKCWMCSEGWERVCDEIVMKLCGRSSRVVGYEWRNGYSPHYRMVERTEDSVGSDANKQESCNYSETCRLVTSVPSTFTLMTVVISASTAYFLRSYTDKVIFWAKW